MRKVTLTKQEELVLERGVQIIESDPLVPANNQLWLNKDERSIKYYNGTEILPLSQIAVNATVVLTAQNILEKSITLASAPKNPSQVIVTPEGGPAQVYATDFTIVDANKVTWSGLGLDGFLEAGERLFISYVT